MSNEYNPSRTTKNIISRKALGLSTTDKKGHYIGDQPIKVDNSLITLTCNYPGCNHILWLWEFLICTQCINELEKQYPYKEISNG